jgi:hypothetical protein
MDVTAAFKNLKFSFDVPSVACALSQTMHYTFYSRLLGYTLFPFAMIAVMALPTLFSMARQLVLTDRLFGMFLRRSLNVLFLVHPIVRFRPPAQRSPSLGQSASMRCAQVSEVVLSALVCTDLAYDGSYLKYDTRIDCNSPEYAAYRAFALSMVAVWVLGYPLSVLGLLFYYKVPAIAARKQRRAKLRAFLTHSLRLGAFTAAQRDRLVATLDSLDELNLAELRYLAELYNLDGASTLPADSLVKALNRLMERMIDSESIAVPVVRWDQNAPDEDERCACNRVGQVFMQFEVKFWMCVSSKPSSCDPRSDSVGCL